MKQLLKKVQHYTLHDALMLEKEDAQFKALEYLYQRIEKKENFFPLILANSTVGYLLSSSGEDYWKEFAKYFSNKKISTHISQEIKEFLPISKGNKRLNSHKNKRLEKLGNIFTIFDSNCLSNSEDFIQIHRVLTSHMKQKPDAKTITFTIKMLSYGARIVHKKDIILPFEIDIPIDSRLIKLYEKYNENKKNTIKKFYKQLSGILKIPPIHLDGIIWTKYKELLED